MTDDSIDTLVARWKHIRPIVEDRPAPRPLPRATLQEAIDVSRICDRMARENASVDPRVNEIRRWMVANSLPSTYARRST